MTILLLLVCLILLPLAFRAFVAMLPVLGIAFGGLAVITAVWVIFCLATASHDSQKSFAQQQYEQQLAALPTTIKPETQVAPTPSPADLLAVQPENLLKLQSR